VGWNAVLVLAGGAASIPAVLVAARDVAGERAARAAAPFLVLVPAMIWWSSGDALFTGVSAWSVTAIVVATGRTGRRGDRLAAAGGVGLGVTAFLSYGLVLVALVPLVVAIARRNLRPVRFVALGAGAVFLAFAAGGFWWPDGLAATHAQYYAGVAARRPYSYFLVGDLAAFALALGPVAAVALARLRDRRLWWLVGGCLAAVAVADLSGMSKAEVERIWLPFVPWVLVATAAFGLGRSSRATRWLAVQGAAALAIAVTVRSPW
jgi:4-amino-4-deoxy-L-arabinose transferase-like glycosyltransferase